MSKVKKMALGGPAGAGAGPLAGRPILQRAMANGVGPVGPKAPVARPMGPATSVAPTSQMMTTMKKGGKIDGVALRGKTKGKKY